MNDEQKGDWLRKGWQAIKGKAQEQRRLEERLRAFESTKAQLSRSANKLLEKYAASLAATEPLRTEWAALQAQIANMERMRETDAAIVNAYYNPSDGIRGRLDEVLAVISSATPETPPEQIRDLIFNGNIDLASSRLAKLRAKYETLSGKTAEQADFDYFSTPDWKDCAQTIAELQSRLGAIDGYTEFDLKQRELERAKQQASQINEHIKRNSDTLEENLQLLRQRAEPAKTNPQLAKVVAELADTLSSAELQALTDVGSADYRENASKLAQILADKIRAWDEIMSSAE